MVYGLRAVCSTVLLANFPKEKITDKENTILWKIIYADGYNMTMFLTRYYTKPVISIDIWDKFTYPDQILEESLHQLTDKHDENTNTFEFSNFVVWYQKHNIK